MPINIRRTVSNFIRPRRTNEVIILSRYHNETPGRLSEELGGARLVRNIPRLFSGIVFNFGKSDFEVPRGARYRVLNKPSAVRNAKNKLSSLRLMRRNNVNVPNHWNRNTNNHEIGTPVVGRPNRHQGGNGFQMCLCNLDLDRARRKGADYFVSYVPVKDEYRYHYFCGDIIRVVKKVPDEGYEEPNSWIRSNTRGWVFKKVRDENVDQRTCRMVKRAFDALGLDFGAADVVTSDGGITHVLEINSAPGLEGSSLEAYSEKIKGVANARGR